MYSKKFRLPIGKEKMLWQRNFPSPYFLVKIKKNQKGFNRFGIVIANHAVKSSAQRHFWKRSIADALAGWPNLEKDILVIVSPKIETTDKKMLQAELNKVLKQLQS